MRRHEVLNFLGITFLGLIVLWLVKALFFPTGYGFAVRYNMPEYHGSSYGQAYSAGIGYNSFPSLLIQILIVLFTVALLAGIFMVAINFLFSANGITAIKSHFPDRPNQAAVICDQCGKELNPEWNVCPCCGNKAVKPSQQ